MNTRVVAILSIALLLVVGTFTSLTYFSSGASAGPEIVGEADGATERYLIADGEDVRRIVYVDSGVKTMANTTPVVGETVCGNYGDLHRADVYLTGTMAGTAPTLAIKWQNSLDGVTWTDVGTWTTINATVTPAAQSQVVADIRSSTAVAFGDCWRATYTFGGTGTVTADFKIVGIEK